MEIIRSTGRTFTIWHTQIVSVALKSQRYTVESRYLELRYLKFCKLKASYLNQKYILIAFSKSITGSAIKG